MNPDIAVWKQMSGSGIHVACVGLVFWLLVHREDEARHTTTGSFGRYVGHVHPVIMYCITEWIL